VRQFVLLTCLLAGGSSTALAWGPTGHRASASIAENYLNTEAALGIEAILGSQSLAEASNWADEMRSNPSDFWQKQAGPWHYVTVPSRKTYEQVGAPAKGDAVTALTRFRKILLDRHASLAERQLALKFSLHIIADLHQPLHVGNGKDRGGTQVKIRHMGRSTNLHALWDSGLIRQQQLSYSEWADWLQRAIAPEQAEAWMNPYPQVWISESAKLRRRVYPGSQNVGYEYSYEHLPALKERLQQAGVRTAAWFNALFLECSTGPQPVCVVQASDEPPVQ
jgi:hypothetical protein